MPQLIGRVVMNHRGAYSASAEYSLLDGVRYQGTTYVYVNSKPAIGKPVTDTAHWEIMAEKGSAATISVGTVTGGVAGSPPVVTNSGDAWNAKFNFTIPKGDKGDAATIELGTVTTGAAGSNVIITNTGAPGAAKFNFTIPRGDVPTISVGTVTTGAAGSNVIVSNSGTATAAKFDFTIPRGAVPTIELGTVTTGAAGSNVAITNTGTSTAAKFNFTIPRGDVPTISVGTVTTGAAGSNVIVSNSGTATAAKFDFTIPRGAVPTIELGLIATGSAGSNVSITNTGTATAAKFNFTIPKGDKGDAATIELGTVTTGAAGSSVIITNTGGLGAAKFNFTIPKGDKGDKGDAATIELGTVTTGAAGSNVIITNTGAPGAAKFNFTIPRGDVPTISVGTVTTGAAGSNVIVSNSGTATAAKFNFTIPRGAVPTIELGTVTTGAPGSQVSITNVGTATAAKFNFTIPRGDTGTFQAGAADSLWVNFTAATTRANLITGDTFPIMMGKLSKWYTDLKSIAFTGSGSDIIAGRVPVAQGGVPVVQTANSATFLRNDNTWQLVTPSNIGALPVIGGTLTGEVTQNGGGYTFSSTTEEQTIKWKSVSTDLITVGIGGIAPTSTSATLFAYDWTNNRYIWRAMPNGDFQINRPLVLTAGLMSTGAEGIDIDTGGFNFKFKSTAKTTSYWAISSSSGEVLNRLYNDPNKGLAGMVYENGYWGLTTPGYWYSWIRFSGGILPENVASKGSGLSSIGSPGWYWKEIYADNHYGTWQGDVLATNKIPNLDASKITSGSAVTTTNNIMCFDGSTWNGRYISVANLQILFNGIGGLALNTTGRNHFSNQIVRTNSAGYLECGYINSNVARENLAVSNVWYEYMSDGYIRKCTPGHLGIPQVATVVIATTTVAAGGFIVVPFPVGVNVANIINVTMYNNGAASLVYTGYSSGGMILSNPSSSARPIHASNIVRVFYQE